MLFLVHIVVAMIGAVATAPQAILPMGHSIMAHIVAPSILPSPYSTLPVSSVSSVIPGAPGAITLGHNIVYPSLDYSMGRSSSVLANPVEETPEVKRAGMDFDVAYSQALMGAQEGTTVYRAKRTVARELPYGYNLPYSGYETPYAQIAHSPTVPSISASPSIPSKVVSPYHAHL